MNWEFVQAGIGEWRWRKVDKKGKVFEESRPGFTSKSVCFEDARANGYPGDVIPTYFESLQMKSDKPALL